MNEESNNNSNVNYDVDPSMIFGNNPANGINPDASAPSPAEVEAPIEQTPAAPEVVAAPVDAQTPQVVVTNEVQVDSSVPSNPQTQEDALVNNPNMIQDGGEAYFPIEEKKSKAPIIILCIVLFAVLLVGGFFAYTMFFANPFKRVSNKLIDTLNKQTVIYDKPFKISGDMAFETSDSDLSILNDLSLTYEVSANPEGTKGLLSTGILEKGNKLLGIDAYLENNKVYFKSEEVYDKVLYTEVSGSQNNSVINKDDILYVTQKLTDAFNEAFKKEKLHKESVTLTLNSSSVKVTNNYYLVNRNNYEEIADSFNKSISNDEKLLNILAKYTYSSVEELKESLKDTTNPYSDGEYMKISLYTKGILNDVVGFAVSHKAGEVEYKLIDFVYDNKYVSFISDMVVMKMTIEGKEDNLKVRISSESMSEDGKSEDILTGSIVTLSKNSYKMELNLMKTYTFKYNMKIEENVSINPFDISNSIKTDELSEEESNKILENFEKVLQKSETYSKLMKMFEESFESSVPGPVDE